MVLTLYSSGEIASGLLCTCLPVVPRFFSHFGVKVATIFASRRSKSGSTRAKKSGISKEPIAAWPRSHGKQPLKGDYLELYEQEHTRYPETTISAGTAQSLDVVSTAKDQTAHRFLDLEGGLDSGILKTVQMDQLSSHES